ncbi:WhiB family transcriptional regulator, partial [Nocardia sp. 852002-20019_SCH5090214]|uniref:WhiB family transcriptional regulator n=1 Tax=Nocardia sp. 852002-20019_SCH5090214 TaxID=1834087 RepID=UPI0009ED3560
MTRTISDSPEVDHPVAWPPVLCTEDPDLFFSSAAADVHEAQRICADCPMLARCAGFALASPEPVTDGVFASVRMPSAGADASKREEAIDQLRVVAATGKPAPLHDFSPRKFEGTAAEFLTQVIEL